MKYNILCNISDINQSKDDERLSFTHYILSSLGLDLTGCFPEELLQKNFSLENKIALRNLIQKNNLNIIDYRDGSQEIYLDAQVIAKWKKPWVEYKQDMAEIDPQKKLYASVNLEFWSIFEEKEQDGNKD